MTEGVKRGALPEWFSQARPTIDMIIVEYMELDLQFAGEDRSSGVRAEGPTAADIIASARQAAEAFRSLHSFHATMNAAQIGWDRRYVDEVASLQKAVLTEVLFSLQFRQVGEPGRTREEFSAAMPQFDRRSGLGFTDPFAAVFRNLADSIDRIAYEHEGKVRRGRRVENRFDRLVGRLADLWREAEREPAKAGSKRGAQLWPFERLVRAVQLEADPQSPLPTGRNIAAALERWNAIPEQ